MIRKMYETCLHYQCIIIKLYLILLCLLFIMKINLVMAIWRKFGALGIAAKCKGCSCHGYRYAQALDSTYLERNF